MGRGRLGSEGEWHDAGDACCDRVSDKGDHLGDIDPLNKVSV